MIRIAPLSFSARPENSYPDTKGDQRMATTLLPRDVQQALGLLNANPARDHTVLELAATCHVAPRTLQKHFRQFLGRSPVEVLRDIRLEHVRRELLAGRHDTAITELATRAGFSHLGRFAGWYQDRYGESPSETLRRARNAVDRPVAPSLALPFATDRPVIAVLPFRFTGTPVHHAADLAGECAFALARLRWLTVGPPHDARYHLRGAVHASEAGQLRIKVTLLDGQNSRTLWADLWTGEREDTFVFEERAAHRIAAKLQSVIRSIEIDRAWRKEPEERTAWALSMRALSRAVVLNGASLSEGLEYAEQAIELTPRDPLPLALAAWCQTMGSGHSMNFREKRAAARALAERAARLGATDPTVEVLLAGAYVALNLEACDVHVDRALALDGGCGWAWQRKGWNEVFRGQVAEAMECFQTAMSLTPAGPMPFLNSFGLGAISFETGHYDDAARWWKRGLAECPAADWGNRFLAPALALAGRKDEARASLGALRRSDPDWILGHPRTPQPHTAHFTNQMADGFERLGVRPG